MANIFKYLQDNKTSLSESKINLLDDAILSWLSYYNYPSDVAVNPFSLSSLNDERFFKDKYFFKDASNPTPSKKLFKIIVKHPRYKDLELFDFKFVKDKEQFIQFAAITIKISSSLYAISFRGTDPSFLGWREDFLLACKEIIPSQELAKKYLEEQMKKIDSNFILVGHSKGGNLAQVSFFLTSKENRNRILKVTSLDAPGYMKDFSYIDDFKKEKKKIHKLVPKATFIGMILNKNQEYKIVDSTSFSFFQHNVFTWKVVDHHFVYLSKRTKRSIRLSTAFNNWVDLLSLDEKLKFTTIIFDFFEDTGADGFFTLFFKFPKYMTPLIKIYKNLDIQDKKYVKRLLRLLKSEYKKLKK